MNGKSGQGNFCIHFGISGFIISVLNAIIFSIIWLQSRMERMPDEQGLALVSGFFGNFFRVLTAYKFAYVIYVAVLVLGVVLSRRQNPLGQRFPGEPRHFVPQAAANPAARVPHCPACSCLLEPGAAFCGGCGRKL